MPERAHSADPPPGELSEYLRAELSGMASTADNAERMVQRALQQAVTGEDFVNLRRTLREFVRMADAFTDRLRVMVTNVDNSAAEWTASRRYRPEGLAGLEAELETTARRLPTAAARRWLEQICDAIRAAEFHALLRIADMEFELPEALQEGRAWISLRAQRLGHGDLDAGLELMAAIADSQVPRWDRVIDLGMRSRGHRLAALFTIRVGQGSDEARDHLDRAISLDGGNALNHAERAALDLMVSDFDQAAADAEQAIHLDETEPAGFLMRGMWAELMGEFEDAEEHYRAGVQLMTLHGLESMTRRLSVIDPSGLLLYIACDVLLAADRPKPALALADQALNVGVRGRAQHADARLHQLRSQALEVLGRDAEAAMAAVRSGERFYWSGFPEAAIDQLRRSLVLDTDTTEGRWLLADALVVASYAGGEAAPKRELVDEALQVWQDSAAILGAPTGPDSWAYLTRAIVSDLLAALDSEQRIEHQWRAVLDCERAVVHDAEEGVRWAYLSRFLRGVGLDELAYEAVERAHALSPLDKAVLTERLAVLGNRGQFREAYDSARQAIDSYGEDAWVVGVQGWLAYHLGEYREAITKLDLPLSLQFDLSWYLDLRALCWLALGDLEAARGDFQAIVDGARDGTIPILDDQTAATLVMSNTLVGDAEAARAGLEAARHVSVRDDLSYSALVAMIAFAAGSVEEAEQRMLETVILTANERELDDLLGNTRRRLQLLPVERRDAALIVLDALTKEAERRRRSFADAPQVTPEDELDRIRTRRAASTDDPVWLGGLATDARRRWLAGDVVGAADRYEELLNTSFEPEAKFALARALKQVSRNATDGRDVGKTRAAQQRLVALGEADQVDQAIAVARALLAAGEVAEARAALFAVAHSSGVDRRQLETLEQGLGELEFASDQPTSAALHFEAALATASTHEDPAHIAQLQTRAALARLVAGDPSKAMVHITAALEGLHEAGAFEAGAALLQEARTFLGPGVGSHRTSETLAALWRLIEQLRAVDSAAPATTPDESGPMTDMTD